MCLFACVVYVTQMTLLPVCGAEAKKAERTRAGGDAGEAVPQQTAGGSSMWGWIIGAGAALVAGIGGFLLAGDAADEKGAAKDSAKEADASAAAAEANAAAAAAPAAAENAQVFIVGVFTATVQASWKSNPLFLPSITFTADVQNHSGGISSYTPSHALVGSMDGSYAPAGSHRVRIKTDDEFYNGVATLIDENTIMLEGGQVLSGGTITGY
jgi:hypothetical protein